MSVTTATREDCVAFALEAEVRSRVRSRSWYRANRTSYPWSDYERENDEALRLLLRIRRDGIRAYGTVRLHADRSLKAHRDAVEAAQWAASVAAGEYADAPLADPGDHHVYPAGVGQ